MDGPVSPDSRESIQTALDGMAQATFYSPFAEAFQSLRDLVDRVQNDHVNNENRIPEDVLPSESEETHLIMAQALHELSSPRFNKDAKELAWLLIELGVNAIRARIIAME